MTTETLSACYVRPSTERFPPLPERLPMLQAAPPRRRTRVLAVLGGVLVVLGIVAALTLVAASPAPAPAPLPTPSRSIVPADDHNPAAPKVNGTVTAKVVDGARFLFTVVEEDGKRFEVPVARVIFDITNVGDNFQN